jgi:hypothetical protein
MHMYLVEASFSKKERGEREGGRERRREGGRERVHISFYTERPIAIYAYEVDAK